MTDCDGKKLKKGDQVWTIDEHVGANFAYKYLRLGRVEGFDGRGSAKVYWLTPTPKDVTWYWLKSDQLVRCAGQD